jgi:hypothetical protein
MVVVMDIALSLPLHSLARCFLRLRREDLDTRFPRLLDAVLTAADVEGPDAGVGLEGSSRNTELRRTNPARITSRVVALPGS